MMEEYYKINKETWNVRTKNHCILPHKFIIFAIISM